MKAIACLLLLAAASFAAPLEKRDATATVSLDGLKFEGNVSLVDEKQFSYRQSIFIDIPLVSAAFYSSLSISGNTDGQTGGSAQADGIIGLTYFPPFGLLKFPPTVWVAYFSVGSSAAGVPGSSLQVSVQGAASLVATTYNKIEEKDASGKVIKTVLLKDLTFAQGDYESDTTGDLNWVTFTAKSGTLNVAVTLAVSKVVGKLNVGGATITPQSIESFIEISGYSYASATNHLELTLFAATAAAEAAASFSATHTLIAGSGDSQVYLKFDGSAVVDGKAASVSVSGYAEKDIDLSEFDNSLIETQLGANADLKVSARKVVISFPNGAATISYDPSIGVKAPNSSALLVPALVSVVLAVILALFF